MNDLFRYEFLKEWLDNSSYDLIRYKFLKEWVENATIDEIIGKLILLDERTKELNSLKGCL